VFSGETEATIRIPSVHQKRPGKKLSRENSHRKRKKHTKKDQESRKKKAIIARMGYRDRDQERGGSEKQAQIHAGGTKQRKKGTGNVGR